MSLLTPHIGSQLVDLGSALLLLTCFAIVAQRRLSACVDLFALQSVFLALTAALVAFLTGIHHIYIAAALTVVIKVVVIPRILKQVIERLNVKRELEMNVNVPTGLIDLRRARDLGVLHHPAHHSPGVPVDARFTGDRIGDHLDRVFYNDRAQEGGDAGDRLSGHGKRLFLGATAAAYGMPLIVELGVFFDVLVGALIIGIYSHRLQDAFDSVDTSKLTTLKE